MNLLKKISRLLSPFEWTLWLGGVTVITVFFFIGEDKGLISVLSLLSSALGLSCVIFTAKGHVSGQIISMCFAVAYAALAYFNRYYGEMIIYLALMLPIHVASVVSWLKNPNKKAAHTEVMVNTVSKTEYAVFGVICAAVVCGFYFLLDALNTDNHIVSTISLLTSLCAAYLMLRRCEYFALFFIANDVILIILWAMKAATAGAGVIPSVISFSLFLLNDTYSFINWKRIKRRQRAASDGNQI